MGATKIIVDLPAWAEERLIYILAGVEMFAYKYPNQPLMVKTQQCNMCGLCCMNLDATHFFEVVDGKCEYLEKEVGPNERWLCSLGVYRPHACCGGPDILHSQDNIPEYCSVVYEEK